MVGKNNKLARQQKRGQKVYKYAIKRLSVGVASVAVATGLLFASDAAVAEAAASQEGTEEFSSPLLDQHLPEEKSAEVNPAGQAEELSAADETGTAAGLETATQHGEEGSAGLKNEAVAEENNTQAAPHLFALANANPAKTDSENQKEKATATDANNDINWNIEAKEIQKQEENYWQLNPGQVPIKVSSQEPLRNSDITYEGHFTNAEGRDVIRLNLSRYYAADSAVWQKVDLRFDPALYEKIDFQASYVVPLFVYPNAGYKGVTDRNNYANFTSSDQAYTRSIIFSDLTATAGLTSSQDHFHPIDLVLKKGVTIDSLSGQDYVIQMRTTDSEGKRVYTESTAGGGNRSELPYSSYTKSTVIPLTQSSNSIVLPAEREMSTSTLPKATVVKAKNMLVDFSEENNRLDVLYGNLGNDTTGESFAQRQKRAFYISIDQNLVNNLKSVDAHGNEIADGVIANIVMLKPNLTREHPSEPPVPIKLSDFNYDPVSGKYFLLVAGQDYKNQGNSYNIVRIDNPHHKIYYKDLHEFPVYINTSFNVDVAKLKADMDSRNPKSYFESFEVEAGYVMDNKGGALEFSATADQDITIQPNQTITIDLGGEMPWTEAAKGQAVLEIGGRDGIYYDSRDKYGSISLGGNAYQLMGYDGWEGYEWLRPTTTKDKSFEPTFGTLGARGIDGRVNRYELHLPAGLQIKAGDTLRLFMKDTQAPIPGNVTFRVESDGITPAQELTLVNEGVNYNPRWLRNSYISTSVVLEKTIFLPQVNNIFTDASSITGHSRYQNADIKVSYLDRDSRNPVELTGKSVENKYDNKGNITEDNSTAVAVPILDASGQEIDRIPAKQAFAYEVALPAGTKLVKDMPIEVNNRDLGTLASNRITMPVKALVTFDKNYVNPNLQQTLERLERNPIINRNEITETKRVMEQDRIFDQVIAPENEKFVTEAGYTPNGLQYGSVDKMPIVPRLAKTRTAYVLNGQEVAAGTQGAVETKKYFLGWNTQADGRGEEFTKTTPITENMTVYAMWSDTPIEDNEKPQIAVDSTNIKAVEGQAITAVPVKVTDNSTGVDVRVNGLPEGLYYNPTTEQIEGTVPAGVVTWENDQDEERHFDATITATDLAHNVASQPITVTVQRDTDGDAIPDLTDTDDNDGIEDTQDTNPKAWDDLAVDFSSLILMENQSVPANTVVVAANKDKSTIASDSFPANVTGLTIGADGTLSGVPQVTDWATGETKRTVEVPVSVTGPVQKAGQNEVIEGMVNVTIMKAEDPTTSDNLLYDPTAKTIFKEFGQATTPDEIIAAVVIPDYPADKAQAVVEVLSDPLPDGNQAGTFSVTTKVTYPDNSTDNQLVTVVVKEAPTTPKTNVTGTVQPVNPTADPQDTGLVVENPATDTSITAKDEDGTNIPVEIDPDGKVMVTPGENVDGPIKVTITDPDLANGEESYDVPVNGHTAGNDDNNNGQPATPETPAAPKTNVTGTVQPVNPTADSQDTGLVVENPATDTSITAKDEDGTNIPVEIDPDGKVMVTPGENVDGPIKVTITDPDLANGEESYDVPVNGHTAGQDDNKDGQPAGPTQADQITPTVPTDKTAVGDQNNLTPDEKAQVKQDVEEANKDKFPQPEAGQTPTTVDVGNDGTTTITYPDGSQDTIPGTDLVREKTKVDDSNVLTVQPTDEKQATGITIVNPDKDTNVTAQDEDGKLVKVDVDPATGEVFVTPGSTVDGPITVTVDDPDLADGTKAIEVPVDGHQAGQDDNGSDPTQADQITPTVPTDKTAVGDQNNLTPDEKAQVKQGVEEANKDKFPQPEAGQTPTTVDVGNDGTTTITYPDGSQDTIPGTDLVREKTKVDDSNVLTVQPTDEKQATGITIVNPDKDTNVTAQDEDGKLVKVDVDPATGEVFVTPGSTVDGPITVTVDDPDLADGTKAIEVPVDGHQAGQDDNGSDPTQADQTTPTVPADKTAVGDQNNLTPDEKAQVKQGVEEANKDKFPQPEAGQNPTTVDVGNDGTTTITYPDGSQDTIPGTDLVREKTTIDENGKKAVNPTDEKQGTGITVENPGKDTTVTAKDEDGQDIPAVINPETGEVEVTPGTNVDGPITITINDPDLPEGKQEVEVPVNGHDKGQDDNGSETPPTTEVNDSKVTPVNPTDEKQGTGITVVNPGEDTTVTAKDEDGQDIPVVINPDTGEVEVTPGTNVDGPITVTVEDPDLPGGKQEVEVPVTGHDKGQDDNGSETPPAKTEINDSKVTPVNPTDEKQGTGIIVDNPGQDTTVSAKDEDGQDIPAVINPETGEVEVTPGTNVDGPITVTINDSDLADGKKDIQVPVNGHDKDQDDNKSEVTPDDSSNTPEDKTTIDDTQVKPVQPTDDEQDTGIKVVNPGKDTTVTAKDENGQDIPVRIDENGHVKVIPGKDVQGPITVTINDPDLAAIQQSILVPVEGPQKELSPGQAEVGQDAAPSQKPAQVQAQTAVKAASEDLASSQEALPQTGITTHLLGLAATTILSGLGFSQFSRRKKK